MILSVTHWPEALRVARSTRGRSAFGAATPSARTRPLPLNAEVRWALFFQQGRRRGKGKAQKTMASLPLVAQTPIPSTAMVRPMTRLPQQNNRSPSTHLEIHCD